MSFSSLPPELVHQIVESTVPHTFHSKTYHERQGTFCRLSLVSKLFRSIAQPLLLEIVKLRGIEDATKLPTARALGRRSTLGVVYWLVIDWASADSDRTQEEDRFPESLTVFDTLTELTVARTLERDLTHLLSTASLHLTSLQISYSRFKPPNSIHLPSLRSLTLFGVSLELCRSLVDPSIVPNLRNFALMNAHPSYAGHLRQSQLINLLPQLDTLTLVAQVWLDPQTAFLRAAAPRTLVNFFLHDAPGPATSGASVMHVRLKDYFQQYHHLDEWSTFIQTSPSLSLRSIYLDSSLQPFGSLESTTQNRLETLTRVCQQAKVDLVFETSPFDLNIDPCISNEFVRRQKEQRRKESGGRRT